MRPLLAALAAVAAPAALCAQSGLGDRLELHGALNAAYGKSDTLGVFGVPTKGTSDYRVFTLQGRYRLGAKDQIVAQVFNRRLGASPLASAIPDVTMQWAFWQHREGDFTVKVGRNPLPRGLYNEVRYIGTLLPFFRPPMELQSDAFDAVDGAVLSYRRALWGGVELEQHAFGGGSEWRAIATTSAGQSLRIARTENMFGGQTYLTLPVAAARLGAYAARYGFVQSTGRGYRTNVIGSAEATVGRLKVATEHGRITGHTPANDNRSGYVMGTLRLADAFSVAGQQAYTNRRLFFTNTAMNRVIPEVRTLGASAIATLPGGSVLKVEHHWRNGWAFDAATPPVASQTATSFALSPKQDARYFLVSVAAAF
ncbi:hypothetical protein [Roseisolibacter sp. H3M3-2]|uniref:hypothetical protein n=1 Tax=Roseisolibacter sp. H3M3-2 TaxID=3031323 RepID=UPI0023DA6BF1|nr:hypothetical protein [Roseisolibacter sp. H3M3-2]MDF1503759.1 hypothetical protein [Roseisolibacter sp. H3M3-2]